MQEMSLPTAIALYHLLGISSIAFALSVYYRRPSYCRFLGLAACLLGWSLALAFLLSLVPTNPLRAARLLAYGWCGHFSLYLLVLVARVSGASTTPQPTMQKGVPPHGSSASDDSYGAPNLSSVRWTAAAALVLIAAVTWYSFRIEPFRLEVARFHVSSAKVDRPLKIAVVADYQTDKLEDYERHALARLMAEKPDLIVMPGDYLQADHREGWEALRDATNTYLRELNFSAPLGVYAVGGNADFRRRWPEIFAGLPVKTMLDTTTLKRDDFALSGLAVEDSFNPRLQLPNAGDKFHIAVGHAPDYALSPDVQADLLIAGHTHGGQVCLPLFGPLVTFSQVPRSWAAGLTHIDEQRILVVSRGVGMERRDAPRLRFLCRPQLVFIHVEPANAPIQSASSTSPTKYSS